MTPMFCPLFVWLSPTLLYIIFHYTAFSVRTFYSPNKEGGAQSSNDETTYLIFIFTNLVFIGAINASYGFYLIRSLSHTCGPFTGTPYAIQVLYSQATLITA
jgi:hypothetical protein